MICGGEHSGGDAIPSPHGRLQRDTDANREPPLVDPKLDLHDIRHTHETWLLSAPHETLDIEVGD